MKKHFAPSKPLSILAGVSLFILCALPFTLFRAQIQEMAALGYAGLFAACALSNVSVFLPSSSTLFVLLASSALHPAVCVLVGGLGSALGEQSAYLCGRRPHTVDQIHAGRVPWQNAALRAHALLRPMGRRKSKWRYRIALRRSAVNRPAHI